MFPRLRLVGKGKRKAERIESMAFGRGTGCRRPCAGGSRGEATGDTLRQAVNPEVLINLLIVQSCKSALAMKGLNKASTVIEINRSASLILLQQDNKTGGGCIGVLRGKSRTG